MLYESLSLFYLFSLSLSSFSFFEKVFPRLTSSSLMDNIIAKSECFPVISQLVDSHHTAHTLFVVSKGKGKL